MDNRAIFKFGGDSKEVFIQTLYPNGYATIVNKAGDTKTVHQTYLIILNNN